MIKIFTPLFLFSLAVSQLSAQCNPDTEPPTVVAIKDLCVNIMPWSNQITLSTADLVLTAQDNCSSTNKLTFAVRNHGDGTGFPTDTAGNPQASVTYTCKNAYGLQLVEVWARDEVGNARWDSAIVAVGDKFGVCSIDPLWGDGCTFTEQEQLLMQTTWEFDLDPMPNFHPCFPHPPYTSPCLQQLFIGTNSTTIRPTLNTEPLNGVSTYDLVLINKHILGLEPLDSPYKILAADANNSRSVSTFDIVELRKLILGIYPKLPNRDSWGFVPKNFDFPDPAHPFSTPVPASIVFDYHSTKPMDFVGYKIGDVNGNANPSTLTNSEERSDLSLRLDDLFLQPGQTVEVPLHFSETLDLLGLQFALEFDPALLEISGLRLSERLTLSQSITSPEFYAQPQAGLLTFSWDNLNAPKLPAGEAVLFLEIKALQPVELTKTLRLNAAQLQPELYAADGKNYRLSLDFLAAPKIAHTQVFPATPNPSSGAVNIPIALAAPLPFRLEVFDLQGRQIYFLENTFSAGLQQVEIPAAALGGSGSMLLYRVQLGDIVQSGKLLRI